MLQRKKFGYGIAAECEDFLAGRYAERVESERTRVPSWTWLNLLAHGTEGEVRTAAVGPFAQQGWRRPQAVVAGAIVEVLDDGRMSLAEVQEDVLIPMELVAMHPDKADPSDPDKFFGAVLRTFAAHIYDHTGTDGT